MIRYLPIILLFVSSTIWSMDIEKCYCHGKIYTKQNGVVIDSFDVFKATNIANQKAMPQRIIEKDSIVFIMKAYPCIKK